MKEKKLKLFWIYLIIILLVVSGIIVGVYLLKDGKTNDKNNADEQNNYVIEEDIEEITDDYIYIRKTFTSDKKHAKVEYKFENSMYEIKINDNVVKNAKTTNGRNYQIEQIKDAIIIATKANDDVRGLVILAFDFTGKQILIIDDYVDAENYMSLRTYGDSKVYDNWAFQITDSTIYVISGKVIAGDIDGISNPCSKTEIAEAKFTNDTMMAAQYAVSYLGSGKFSSVKMERITVDYAQYKKLFSCR